MWVKSEYASELAVLSAWIAVLLPWNVAWKVVDHADFPLESTVVFFRFALFEIQFRRPATIALDASEIGGGIQQLDASGALAGLYPGTELGWNVFVTTPPTAAMFYDTPQLVEASLVWTLAAICFFVAFVFSIVLYFREDRVRERLPVPVTVLMGGLLGAGALGTAIATGLFAIASHGSGMPLPIGVVVVGLLAIVLLRTERV